MFWPALATIYGCALLFVASRSKMLQLNTRYLSNDNLFALCLMMGLGSLSLSALLWASLHGWQRGIFYLAICVGCNFIVLYCTRPKVQQLIVCSVMLIGSSFIFSTASIVTEVISSNAFIIK
ncbi:MAG: hypothetical protein HRU25_00030 [Psychrobium sp.]|nr:hypothetical protein [Psychrobium sp.]